MQAVVAKEYRSRSGSLLAELWVKELSPNSSRSTECLSGHVRKAIAFLNRSDIPMKLDAAMAEAGIAGKILSIRELCRHETQEPPDKICVMVPPHGISVFLVEGTEACPWQDCNVDLKIGQEKFPRITEQDKTELLNRGALLVDVRSSQEFEKTHLSGAINIPYADIYLNASKFLPDKDQAIIVYCATGKRSVMAKERLDHMGYRNVYFLGGIF